MMNVTEPKRYHEGPGFARGNAASQDGAVMAAPVKATQERLLLEQIAKSMAQGVTSVDLWDFMRGDCTDIQLSTVRARLTTLKLVGKIVALEERRMARFGVAIHAYVLPQYGPKPNCTQGSLWPTTDPN